MSITAKLMALLSAMTPSDIEALPPARRERLGQLLKHWGSRCDQPNRERRPGVLSDLKRAPRDE